MRQGKTLYDVLGVSSAASDEEVRAAFRRLTQQHHPDRFTGADRGAAELRFQEITEAFNVLRKPESRERYDRELSQGSRTKAMEPAEIARRSAAKGAQAYREGKLAEALDSLQNAINHDETCSRAHFFLGLYAGAAGR